MQIPTFNYYEKTKLLKLELVKLHHQKTLFVHRLEANDCAAI